MNQIKPPNIIQIIILAVHFVLMVVGFKNLIRKPLPFRDKWKWMLLLFVDIIGPIIYLTVGSKKLDSKVDALCECEECA